jgi:hypothetical protein
MRRLILQHHSMRNGKPCINWLEISKRMGSRDASQLKQKYKYMCKRGERVKFDSEVEVLFTAVDDETIRGHITTQMQHAKGAQQQMQMWVELAARMNRSRQSIQTRWEDIRPPPPVAPVVPRVRKTPASRKPPRVTTLADEEEEEDSDDDGAFSDESVDEASPVVSAAAVVRRMPINNKARGNAGGNTSEQPADGINRGRVTRQASDQEEEGDEDEDDDEERDACERTSGADLLDE